MAATNATTSAEDSTPCATEAVLWRECLKDYDYSPDKPRGACEPQRDRYYICIKDWTARTQKKEYHYKNFELDGGCSHEAEKLHHCMMMSMFEVTQCQAEMTLLKRCAAKRDPEVRRSLEGDPAIADLERSVEQSTGLRRLWYKAIGKL